MTSTQPRGPHSLIPTNRTVATPGEKAASQLPHLRTAAGAVAGPVADRWPAPPGRAARRALRHPAQVHLAHRQEWPCPGVSPPQLVEAVAHGVTASRRCGRGSPGMGAGYRFAAIAGFPLVGAPAWCRGWFSCPAAALANNVVQLSAAGPASARSGLQIDDLPVDREGGDCDHRPARRFPQLQFRKGLDLFDCHQGHPLGPVAVHPRVFGTVADGGLGVASPPRRTVEADRARTEGGGSGGGDGDGAAGGDAGSVGELEGVAGVVDDPPASSSAG